MLDVRYSKESAIRWGADVTESDLKDKVSVGSMPTVCGGFLTRGFYRARSNVIRHWGKKTEVDSTKTCCPWAWPRHSVLVVMLQRVVVVASREMRSL